MKYQYVRSMLRLLHGNDIVINTYEVLVYSQHVTVVDDVCTISTISSYELVQYSA